MFTLGLDSQFGTVQGVIQAAVDLKIFPDSVRKEFQTGQDRSESDQDTPFTFSLSRCDLFDSLPDVDDVRPQRW